MKIVMFRVWDPSVALGRLQGCSRPYSRESLFVLQCQGDTFIIYLTSAASSMAVKWQ